ncbi:hypothetical protein HZB07_00035 [Candidatus Saganbacteria bacterium]|nr:hypothetical protein [Candidatus Saganbacteria bacterium]
MGETFRIASFQRIGERLNAGSQIVVQSKLSRTSVNFHDAARAHELFTSQPNFRASILRLPENVDLVCGEIRGQTFVLDAAQAKELFQNAVDENNLIAGLQP